MREIVDIVKRILGRHHASGTNRSLPIEIIFDQFSAENGESLLQPFFKTIEAIDFKNTLVFQSQEIRYFMDYFQFKKSFFLSEQDANNQTIIRQLFKELQETLSKNQIVSMCKDDRIFICSQPSTGKDSHEKTAQALPLLRRQNRQKNMKITSGAISVPFVILIFMKIRCRLFLNSGRFPSDSSG
jgi:hypothetical protein